jgi:hypothetical protein
MRRIYLRDRRYPVVKAVFVKADEGHISVFGRKSCTNSGAAGIHDRRVWSLQRLRLAKALFDREEFPGVVELLFDSPQFAHDLDPIVGIGVARVMVHRLEPEHSQFLRVPAAHHVERKAATGEMIDGRALFGGDDGVDGWHMCCAEDCGVVCHRPHAGCPRQRLETGAVEIRFAAEAFPAGYRHHRFEASEIGKSDDIAAVRPVHFETARRGGRRAAIADIAPKTPSFRQLSL